MSKASSRDSGERKDASDVIISRGILTTNKTTKMKKRLAPDMGEYIQRQKTIIRKLAKDKTEEDGLTRELLDRFHKKRGP